MTVETKWNIGDVVWSFVAHRYGGQSCGTCDGGGGATIPGTGVWVTCQDCGGTGTAKPEWYSVDVWRAQIDNIITEIKWREKRADTTYTLVGFQRSGERTGCRFNTSDESIFTNEADALSAAKAKAATLPDGHVRGEKIAPLISA